MRTISITIPAKNNSVEILNRYLLNDNITDKSVTNIIPHSNFIEYEITSRGLNTNSLFYSVSKSLSEYYYTECRKSFMINYAKKKIEVLSVDEYSILSDKVLNLIETNSSLDNLKEEIYSVINDYGTFSVDGFFRFRLNKEQSVWRCAVDMIADDIMVEREYDNFIELMKVFLEVQVPKTDIVHIFMNNGILKIYDEHLIAYDTQHLKEIAVDMTSAPVCEDDLTVSILLALAPRVVIIHEDGKDVPPALKTIKRVFENRICSN